MSTATVWPYLTVIIGVVAWLLDTRGRRLPIASPFSLMLLTLIGIFGVRPLLMSTPADYDFYGIDISSGAAMAQFIGFLGVLAFVVGRAVRTRRIESDRAELKATVENRMTDAPVARSAPLISAMVGLFLLALWFLALIRIGGGVAFISRLFGGRSAAVADILTGLPSVVFILPIIATTVVASIRLLYERSHPYSTWQKATYWLVIALAVIPPTALGTRRFLLPTLVIASLGVMKSRSYVRLSWRWVFAATCGFIALAAIPFVRSAGSRTESRSFVGAMFDYITGQGLSDLVNGFFLSYDTEMFNYVAYLAPRMGSTIPLGLGRGTIAEAVVAPFPASLAPYTSWSDQLLTGIFGGPCGQPYCPVPSVVGTLYLDLGYVGLIAGMFAIGMASWRFERAFVSAVGWRVPAVLLVSGFAVQFARGNPASQLWLFAQALLVALVFVRVVWLISHVIDSSPGSALQRRHAELNRAIPSRPNGRGRTPPSSRRSNYRST